MRNLFFLPFFVFLIASCGSNENRILSEDVSAFIEKNETISVFGYVDVKAILDKAEYQSIEKFGSEMAKEVGVIEKLIDKNEPFYFAMESTTDLSGKFPAVYAFASVKNRDSLVLNLQKKGYDMEKNDTYDLHESGDVAFAITDNRVVFLTKPGLTKSKQLIEKAIDDLKSDCPDNKVKEILSEKGDIVIGSDVEASYSGLDKIVEMDANKKNELKKMAENCYSQVVVTFDKGAMDMNLKNFFNDELKGYLALGQNSENVVSKLGSGPVQAAFAMNLDMKKIQSFLDKFAPNFLEKTAETVGGFAQAGIAMLGDEGLAGLFSGKMGIALMGNPDQSGAFKPEFNFYIKLGNKILPMAKGMVDGASASLAKLELNGEDLVGATSKNYLGGNGGLTLPKGCESFGKKPISGFISFDGLDMSNFDLEDGDRYIKLFSYLTFEIDSDGGKIHLDAKNKQKNVLKVIADEASLDIKDKVSNIQ